MKTFEVWYCAHCQRGVDASEVTFHEQHTVCGRTITDDTPPVDGPVAAPQRESVTVRYDLSPAQTESAIRDALIRMGWTPPEDESAATVKAERDALHARIAELEQDLQSTADSLGHSSREAEAAIREKQELLAGVNLQLKEIERLRDRITELEAENRALLARAAVLVDALELARGEIAHYFKEIRHLGGSWEVKCALDRVDQVLDAYLSHGDAAMKEGKS